MGKAHPRRSPSPPRGEGRGEGDAWRGYRENPRHPHPNPLPGGERGHSQGGRGPGSIPLTSPRGFRRRSA
ncbi:hypothetical protein FZ983_31295 [Azospirillum sp. B21]|nr:hypothetical protein FZ983_31295 [Azospirillum sp. B21]